MEEPPSSPFVTDLEPKWKAFAYILNVNSYIQGVI